MSAAATVVIAIVGLLQHLFAVALSFVAVVAIFEVGNPQWYGPTGPRATVIAGELAGRGISAAPLHNPPGNPVAVARVSAAVREILS